MCGYQYFALGKLFRNRILESNFYIFYIPIWLSILAGHPFFCIFKIVYSIDSSTQLPDVVWRKGQACTFPFESIYMCILPAPKHPKKTLNH